MTELSDVLGLDPSGSLVRAVAIALPVAVFLTLLVLLRVKSKDKSQTSSAGTDASHAAAASAGALVQHPSAQPSQPMQPATGSQPGVAVLEPVRSAPARPTAVRSGDDGHTADTLMSDAAAPPVARPHAVDHSAPAAVAPAVSEPALPPIEALKLQLADAAATAPKTELAPLYLELAKHCRSAGDEAAFMAALRSAAGYGALHGPRAAHAAARIELAEVALNSGDAIGACEQWQIARLVLHEEGLKDAYHRIDKRMRENGCPTDWVLTDF